jgi:hypothetical protein
MSKKQNRIFWPVLLLIIGISGALILVSVRASRVELVATPARASVAKRVSSSVTMPLMVQRNTPNGRVEVEPTTLRTEGFEPARITRPQGRFLLAVDNRSQVPDLVFVLDRVAGIRQVEKRMRGRQLRWRQLLDLSPGDYLLTEANHPAWRCVIRITAR